MSKPASRPRLPKRPAPLTVGDVRARVVRGPHRDAPARWYWQAVRYEGGSSVTVWSGWATAKEATQQIAARVADGDRPAAPARHPDDVATVADLLEVWLCWMQSREDIAQSTSVAAHVRAVQLSRGTIGAVLLERLRTTHLEAHLQERLADSAAPSSVRQELGALVHAWRWGWDRGLTPERILAMPTRIPRRPVRSRYIPSREEFWRATDQLPTDRPWMHTLAVLLAGTGARISEAAALRWEDVAWDRRRVLVGTTDGAAKTGQRWVAVTADLLEHLRGVWPGEGASGRILPIAMDTARKAFGAAWRAACAAVGVPYGPPKQLRAMAENEFYRAGGDPGQASVQFGHSAQVSLQHYRAATEGEVADVVDRAQLGARPDADVVSLDERRRRGKGA